MSEGGLDGESRTVGQGLSRRRLMMGAAKGGTAVAAAVWIAPHLESVAFAAGSQGSPCPDPGNPVCGPTSSTSPTTGGTGVTCGVDPKVVEQGNRVRFFGTGWKASSRVKVVLVGQRVIGQIT